MAETTKSIIIDVTTGNIISRGEIAIAVDLFSQSYIDRPELLVMHSSAYRELMQQEAHEWLNPKTYMGMDIKVDNVELPKDGWCVRKVDSKTYRLNG